MRVLVALSPLGLDAAAGPSSGDVLGEARDVEEEFEPVVAAIRSISPRIEVLRPGVVALDARGPTRYFGGEAELCERVREAARVATGRLATGRPGCARPRVGIAGGRFAAEIAARRDVIVRPGGDAEFLSRFPLSVLVDAELEGVLGSLGISTLGEFAALPKGSVLGRFGAEAGRLHDLARGRDDRVLGSTPAREEFVSSAVMEPASEVIEAVLRLAADPSEELIAELEIRGLISTCVEVLVVDDEGNSISRVWTVTRDRVGFDAGTLIERLRCQLEELRLKSAEPAHFSGRIERISFKARDVVPVGVNQVGLWGGTSDADERAMRCIDRVQAVLGPGAVRTAVIRGGRMPRERVEFVPWGTDPKKLLRTGVSRELPWPGRLPRPSPALVHDPVLTAELLDDGGSLVIVTSRGRLSARPARLRIDRRRWLIVVDWGGPWTIDERWWDFSRTRRLARVQLLCERGAGYLCVFEAKRWWVEASYD